MADPSCDGPSCLFTGDGTTSYTRKGRCTQTGGYLANAELNEIGGRTRTDTDSDSLIMVDGDLSVSYMDDDLKASRTQLYQRYEMGRTIDWAVYLVKFQDPPNYGVDDGVNLGLSWSTIKKQILLGDDVNQIGCDGARMVRTGDWVSKVCTVSEVAEPSAYTPSQRWDALECQHGWEDVIRVWWGCHAGGKSDFKFPKVMAEFLHAALDAVSRTHHGIKGIRRLKMTCV